MKVLPRWFWTITASVLLLASLPYLFGLAIQPEGTLYLVVHSNYDDHAVYASWTKQAQEGRFFFENRFTTDDQAGKTIHLYFLAAGWLAKAVGIPVALHTFRVVFGFLFLLSLFRLIRRYVGDETTQVLAFCGSIVCAGVGFLFWRNFGFGGPIDVWQPEAFAFPSLMQNGLFCAALWLTLCVWHCILDARTSWRSVLPGALALIVLTNIHTYDTLLIAIVSVGFLASMIGARTSSGVWLCRAIVIAAGALPALAWFTFVRRVDPVFAARADTVTISAPFWWVLLGILPALLFAGLALRKHGDRRAVTAACAVIVGAGVLQYFGDYRMVALWATPLTWAVIALLCAAACYMYKPENAFYGLLFSWITMGLIALYYPGLFQRKLAMGLAIPIGLAAGIGFAGTKLVKRLIMGKEHVLASVAFLFAIGATSLLWLAREARMATSNLSNTTMQRIYWSDEVRKYLRFFQENAASGDALIAIPGIAVPNDFENPSDYGLAIADLNALMSGWGGIKTYAGHWSETPEYLSKRTRVMNDLFSQNATRETAYLLMTDARANYILAPKTEIARQAGVPDPQFYSSLGEIVFEGDEWVLVRFRPSP
ncbi:MAG: hypothetical protein M3R13_00410 [Armatimonadota bacterium]|nr:hypothetical protein [Armatimonadota bacterium]